MRLTYVGWVRQVKNKIYGEPHRFGDESHKIAYVMNLLTSEEYQIIKRFFGDEDDGTPSMGVPSVEALFELLLEDSPAGMEHTLHMRLAPTGDGNTFKFQHSVDGQEWEFGSGKLRHAVKIPEA